MTPRVTVASEPHANVANLWLMAAGPFIWACHFLASYVTASVWCAKYAGRDGSLGWVSLAIAIYTALALLGIVIVGFSGYRRHGKGFEVDEHEMDTPRDRHRFLGFSTLLLAALSFVATVYVVMTVAFFSRCQ